MTNRREFLKSTYFAGLGLSLAGLSAPVRAQSPNERLNLACIGVGGKGESDTEQAAQQGVLVAICDIDDNHLMKMALKFPEAKRYNDFRKMLEEMGDQIDAVTVSTPDHTHAPASIMAMKMGKHVYCQKPLTHSVHEARQMREIARRQKLVTQMGNQGTAHSGLRQAVEVIRAGAIGPIREVHVWTNRPMKFWKQAPDIVERPKDSPPVPPHVHWDEFLGPAQLRPYNPVYHPFHWRGWWDFGTGALGDMACHTANMAFMALNLGLPRRVSAQHSEVNPETYPAWATVTYEFAASEDRPAVKLFWYEGARNGTRNLPDPNMLMGERFSDSGSLIVGDKGVLFSPNDYGAAFKLLPLKDFEGYAPPEPTLPRLEGRDIDANMKFEWARAIRGGPPTTSNFGYSATFTECMLLGNVAIRTGHSVDYNGRDMRISNCREANAYLRTEYREGWKV